MSAMSLRWKEGDLALAVGDPQRCKASIGRIMEARGYGEVDSGWFLEGVPHPDLHKYMMQPEHHHHF